MKINYWWFVIVLPLIFVAGLFEGYKGFGLSEKPNKTDDVNPLTCYHASFGSAGGVSCGDTHFYRLDDNEHFD